MMLKCDHILEVNKNDHTYMFPDGTVAGHLCDTCAEKQGFCPFCGYFVLGSDDDRTLERFGCCTECFGEIVSDMEYSDPEAADDWNY